MTELVNETDLQALAERGAAELEGASADDLLRWTDENFGGNYIVASNMQDAVLVDLAAKVRPGVDVLFLDTGYHFVETIGTRDAVEAVYDINVVNATPENSVEKQDELFGKDLFAREPNECCRMRKVEPLSKALRGYAAWVTGIRRVEAPTRANAPLISWDKAFGLVKINPLAAWTDEVVRDRDLYSKAGSPEWLSGACMLVRRTALDAVGGLDEGYFLYCEDMDLCLRLRAAGYDIRYEPAATAHHVGGASSVPGQTLAIYARSRVRYARRHYRRSVVPLEAAGVALGALSHIVAAARRPALRRGHTAALRAVLHEVS